MFSSCVPCAQGHGVLTSFTHTLGVLFPTPQSENHVICVSSLPIVPSGCTTLARSMHWASEQAVASEYQPQARVLEGSAGGI